MNPPPVLLIDVQDVFIKFLMLAETCSPFLRPLVSVSTVRPVTADNESIGRFRLYLKCLIFYQG